MSLVTIPDSLLDSIPFKPEVNIPKIIHQTYKSLEQLPNVWKDTPAEWKRYHPDWKYCFWSDKDCRQFVNDQFPDFLETYDGYEYNIQRADAIRPMVLYFFGGLYADCDIQPVKSFDDLFYADHDLYLIRTSNGNVVTNCLMASKPKVRFWRLVIDEMKYRAANPSMFWIGKHISVMYTTGPMLVNSVFNENESKLDVSFLPREFIVPSSCGTCVPKPCTAPMGYTKLLEGSSWIEYDTMMYNFLMCKYPNLLVIFAVAFLLYNMYAYLTTQEVR